MLPKYEKAISMEERLQIIEDIIDDMAGTVNDMDRSMYGHIHTTEEKKFELLKQKKLIPEDMHLDEFWNEESRERDKMWESEHHK
jgi:hypothetical protein